MASFIPQLYHNGSVGSQNKSPSFGSKTFVWRDILAAHVIFREYSPVTGNVYQQFTHRFIHDFFIVPCWLVLYCSTPRDYPAALIRTSRSHAYWQSRPHAYLFCVIPGPTDFRGKERLLAVYTVTHCKGGKFKNFPVTLSWRFNFFMALNIFDFLFIRSVSCAQISRRGGWNREVNLPSPYFLSQFLPPLYFLSQFLPPP